MDISDFNVIAAVNKTWAWKCWRAYKTHTSPRAAERNAKMLNSFTRLTLRRLKDTALLTNAVPHLLSLVQAWFLWRSWCCLASSGEVLRWQCLYISRESPLLTSKWVGRGRSAVVLVGRDGDPKGCSCHMKLPMVSGGGWRRANTRYIPSMRVCIRTRWTCVWGAKPRSDKHIPMK